MFASGFLCLSPFLAFSVCLSGVWWGLFVSLSGFGCLCLTVGVSAFGVRCLSVSLSLGVCLLPLVFVSLFLAFGVCLCFCLLVDFFRCQCFPIVDLCLSLADCACLYMTVSTSVHPMYVSVAVRFLV